MGKFLKMNNAWDKKFQKKIIREQLQLCYVMNRVESLTKVKRLIEKCFYEV